MVQRKFASKLGIQADHVKSEKLFASMKLSSSSQNQDGKSSRRADMKKKMKKSRSIKFSDLDEARQSSSPPPIRCSSSSPLRVPTAAASQTKQPPLMGKTDGSPNYMKPTSSSHAKKEPFPVSHRNAHQSGSDSKNLARKSHSASLKTSPNSSCVSSGKSLSLVRSLTKTTSFKASRSCPRRSTRNTALCPPQRATCSSTLKDSKFPAYLMLNPGGTESEGTSVMNVCPYTHCSLNGHRAALPPLKSFMAARRRLLKIQKSARAEEALSPRRRSEEESETEPSVVFGIYASQVAPSIADIPIAPRSEIDLGREFEKPFDDVAIEVDTKWIFSSHEEISMGEENTKDAEEISGLGHEEEVGSSLFSEFESLSESSHDSSATWLDEEAVLQVSNSEERGYPSNDLGCDQPFLTAEASLEYLTEEEDNGAENEEHVVDETGEDGSIQENDDDESGDEENQVRMLDVPEEEDGTMAIQEKEQGGANETFQNTSCTCGGEEQNASVSSRGAVRCKRLVVGDGDEVREFNPKEPNFLPLVPEPEPETVDLRHQTMDERKDAEQWMIDCALRQVVTKLAPARKKKKVALLVEAFETIMPIPKCETHHVRRNNSAFPRAGRVQACS